MQASEPSPIHLTILRKGEVNIIDLAEMGSARSETQVEGTFLQELVAEAAYLGMPGYARHGMHVTPDTHSSYCQAGSASAVYDLQRLGSLIYSHLLTEPARKRIRAADSCPLYLRLDEQLIHVPWELCHDGNDFLVTKFQVGRQVITSAPLRGGQTEQTASELLKVLLVVDPTESLPQASQEADRLCSLLDEIPGVEVTLLGGRGVRKVPLLAALQTHDIVHFAGHSHYDCVQPSKSGWRLREGVLTAGELSKLTHPPLLVFSNSCQAGATAKWSVAYQQEGQAFGIGSAFLMAGVKNYIGTFWVVHDEESAQFSVAFYRSLAMGHSLGEALRLSRHEVIQQQGWNRLGWASYMLYGDPAFTLHAPRHTTPAPPVNQLPLPVQIEPYVTPALQEVEAKPVQPRISQPRISQRRVLLLSLAIVLLVALGYGLQSIKTLPLLHPSSLLVMKFEPLRLDTRLDWMGEGIRQSLNAQLSRYSDLKVYSKEHLDFHRSARSTGVLAELKQVWRTVSSVFVSGQAAEETDMAVAKRLGISKIIAGSFVTLGPKLRIEAHIIGTTSGVQEASTHVEGEQYEEHFFQLTRELADQIAAHLALSETRPEDTAPATGTPNAQNLRLLLEAEGEVPSVRQPPPPAVRPQSQQKPGDSSFLFPIWKWIGVQSAWAQENELEGDDKTIPTPDPTVWVEKIERGGQTGQPTQELAAVKDPTKRPQLPEKAIRHVLEQYRTAYEAKDLALLDRVYQKLTDTQKEANIRYFHHTQDLQVTIRDIDITVRNDKAVVSYTREDQFVDSQSGKPIRLETRFTKLFVLHNGEWKMTRKNHP